MVWNDFFDLEQDRKERPFRPLPSGRVSRRQAAGLGALLLAGGFLLAWLAGLSRDPPSTVPLSVAAALAAAILLYDAWLKRTVVGPVGMGLCRFLNVLLGMSVTGSLAWNQAGPPALVVGLYITGVTWLARTEARASKEGALAGAAALMLSGLLLALPVAAVLPPGTSSPLFPYLLVGLGFFVGVPVSRAVAAPTPGRVQTAVKRSLMGLVVLDATLASALAGSVGLLILLLLLPSLYLNRQRWLYAT